MGQGLLIHVVLDHTQRRTTAGRLLWTSDQLVALTTHNTQQQTDFHAPGGIRTCNLSRRAAADLRLRPYTPWDWQASLTLCNSSKGSRTRSQLATNDQILDKLLCHFTFLLLQIGISVSKNLNFELCYSEYFSKSPTPFYVHTIVCDNFLLLLTISSFPLRGQRIP